MALLPVVLHVPFQQAQVIQTLQDISTKTHKLLSLLLCLMSWSYLSVYQSEIETALPNVGLVGLLFTKLMYCRYLGAQKLLWIHGNNYVPWKLCVLFKDTFR